LLNDLEAVHIGHLAVEYHQVEGAAAVTCGFEFVERRKAAGGLCHVGAVRRDNLAHDHAVNAIVVDHQRAHSSELRDRRGPPGSEGRAGEPSGFSCS
jgi:hypothetical protein